MKRLLIMGLGSLLLMPTIWAQDIGQAILGEGLAPSIKASELKPEHRAVKIAMPGGGGMMDFMSSLFRAMGGMASPIAPRQDPEDAAAMAIFSAIDIYWTEGKTIKVQDREFLVTYKFDLDLTMFAASEPPKLKPEELQLDLCLVNLANVSSISPKPGMTREKFWDMLKKGASGSDAEPMVPVEEEPTDARSVAVSNMKQLALGAIMYAVDYDDILPYAQSTVAVAYVTEPYLRNTNGFKTLNPVGGRILFNMALAGVSHADIEAPAETILFYDHLGWPDGTRVVAFADGHVRRLTAEEFTRYEPTLRLRLKRHGKPLPPDYGLAWARERGLIGDP